MKNIKSAQSPYQQEKGQGKGLTHMRKHTIKLIGKVSDFGWQRIKKP